MVVVVGNNHDSERRVIMSRLSNTGGVMDIDLRHRKRRLARVRRNVAELAGWREGSNQGVVFRSFGIVSAYKTNHAL